MKTYQLSNPLQRGPDLVPLQKALAAADLYHGPLDGVFGAGTAGACRRAKWRLGYPTAAVNLTGGQQLLDYLTGAQKLPGAYVLRRRNRGYGLTQADKWRAAIVRWWHWGITHEPDIHYEQIRPIPHTAQLPMVTDCSGFFTLCYQLAGAPDPNGFHYNGEGWTGSLLDAGRTIPLYEARPGDGVIWGGSPGHHVACILDMADPADPLIGSHGGERGPLEERLSAETAAQGRPFVVKRFIA